MLKTLTSEKDEPTYFETTKPPLNFDSATAIGCYNYGESSSSGRDAARLALQSRC